MLCYFFSYSNCLSFGYWVLSQVDSGVFTMPYPFFFFLPVCLFRATRGIWRFPGQGSNLSCRILNPQGWNRYPLSDPSILYRYASHSIP